MLSLIRSGGMPVLILQFLKYELLWQALMRIKEQTDSKAFLVFRHLEIKTPLAGFQKQTISLYGVKIDAGFIGAAYIIR